MVDLILILEGLCILGILSYLYRENAIFRLFESIFIGVSIGHIIVMSFTAIRTSGLEPLFAGNLLNIIPLALGLCLYFYFSKSLFTIYRIPMAWLVGVGTAIAIRSAIHGTILAQTKVNFSLLNPAKDIFSNINGLITLLGTVTVLFYFTFTYFLPRKGASHNISQIGILFLMIVFGTRFGNSALIRTAWLSGTLERLWQTDAIWTIPIALVFLIYAVYVDRKKPKPITV